MRDDRADVAKLRFGDPIGFPLPMKNECSRPLVLPARGIFAVLTSLILFLCALSGVRADMIAVDPDKIPMSANQLVMTVQQSGVPQAPAKPGDLNETKIRNLKINLIRIGSCNGHVTLKIAFIGQDAVTFKKVVNGETEKDAEAVPGGGNDYSETSPPFVYVFPSFDKKTKKTFPPRAPSRLAGSCVSIKATKC